MGGLGEADGGEEVRVEEADPLGLVLLPGPGLPEPVPRLAMRWSIWPKRLMVRL